MSAFREIFGVPDAHVLRPAARTPGIRTEGMSGPWEHEEHDAEGRLVAVYESCHRADGGLEFVKYSPHGWVLSISGRSPGHLPEKRAGRSAA